MFFFFSVFAFVFEKNFEVYLSTFDINNKKTIQSVVKLKNVKGPYKLHGPLKNSIFQQFD